MVFVNVFLYIVVPKGFFPQQDTGRLAGMVMGDQDVSFLAMKTKTEEFIHIVMKDPAVQNVLAFVGGNGAQNQGRMFVVLKPLNERKISADQVIARLRPKLSHVPARPCICSRCRICKSADACRMRSISTRSRARISMSCTSGRRKLLERLRKIPQLKDVNSDQQVSGLEENVVIDRDTASRLGITPQQGAPGGVRLQFPSTERHALHPLHGPRAHDGGGAAVHLRRHFEDHQYARGMHGRGIMNAYTESWKLGLKAVAIYRDNSKRVQPLSSGSGQGREEKRGGARPLPRPPRR